MVENRKILSKTAYYILSWTWGFLMSFMGLLVIGSIKIWSFITGKSIPLKSWGYSKYLNVSKGWGGLEFGMWFLTDSSDSKSVKNHEFGHGVQNCFWGPLTLFVIFLPSAIRYWLRKFKTQKSKKIYAAIIGFSLWLIGIGITFIPLSFVTILGCLIATYAIIIWIWLFAKEIPQYASGKHIDYDAIWFEGDASRTGNKYIEHLEGK